MVITATDYERDKALHKLRHPALRSASPNERWRPTQWFGVSPLVLRRLERHGILEYKFDPTNGKDLWREKQ